MSLRVLLVEDDAGLRALIAGALAVEGYVVTAVDRAGSARAAWAHARAIGPRFDVVLLDQGLPDGEGAEWMDEMRRSDVQAPSTPVLILSARDSEAQKVRLLDAGADDYLVKPFTLGELLARIRVALRRRGLPAQAALTRYARAGIEIDLASRTVLREGRAVRLTPREFDLLARLVRSAGQVVTHRRLLADVWGAEHVEQLQYLRQYATQLRAKLESDPTDPSVLLTEPGVGYRLAATEDGGASDAADGHRTS